MPGYLGPSLSHATQLYPRIPISRVILEFPECGKGPLWFSSAIKLNPLTSLWKFRSRSAILMMVFRINLQATPASPASRSSRCDCSGPKGPSNREQTLSASGSATLCLEHKLRSLHLCNSFQFDLLQSNSISPCLGESPATLRTQSFEDLGWHVPILETCHLAVSLRFAVAGLGGILGLENRKGRRGLHCTNLLTLE